MLYPDLNGNNALNRLEFSSCLAFQGIFVIVFKLIKFLVNCGNNLMETSLHLQSRITVSNFGLIWRGGFRLDGFYKFYNACESNGLLHHLIRANFCLFVNIISMFFANINGRTCILV